MFCNKRMIVIQFTLSRMVDLPTNYNNKKQQRIVLLQWKMNIREYSCNPHTIDVIGSYRRLSLRSLL